jgi:NAD(P)-dependent dehydrogenase (short-subunit alcohol dehydrogenase family)
MREEPPHGAVLVTGASSGIGEATAWHLGRLGFTVFATVRTDRDAGAFSGSERLVPILMDVTDPDSIVSARDQITSVVGDRGLTGLVNNAGVGFLAPLELVPDRDLRWVFDVNVFGLLATTRAFLPLLRRGTGRIVNVTSTASIFVAPFHGVYSGSKLAVNAFSDALRLELSPFGVEVSVVVCGVVKTPMWEKGSALSEEVALRFAPDAASLYEERYRRVRERFFRMGKGGVPVDVAAKRIAHALTTTRPHARYYVGPDATLYRVADKLLYGRLRDWVVARSTG